MGSNCPICLEDVVGKVRACPDSCDHIFCFPCLEKWSKLGSYCPVDRKRFKKILNLDSSDTIQVKPRKRKRARILYDISTLCEVCKKDNDPTVMLLCDSCDLGFHTYCLSPPLKAIPVGAWNCPTCNAVERKLKDKKGITKEVEAHLYNYVQEINVNATKSELVKKASKKNWPIQNRTTEECDRVITDYEEISVKRNFVKNVFCSNTLNDSINCNGIDKIYKTFNYEPQSCRQKSTKYCRTYDLLGKNKKNVSKTFSEEHIPKVNKLKLQSSNVDDMCLKNDISEEINLLEPYLFKGGAYGYMKPDKLVDDALQSRDTQVPKIDIYVDPKENKFSSTSSVHPESLNITDISSKDIVNSSLIENGCSFTNSVHPESLKNTDINSKEIATFSINGNDFQEECQNINKSLEEEIQSNPKTVVNQHAEAKSISKRLHKGTYNLTFDSLNENSKPVTKEKIHFSVFDKIGDIDSSQKKYSEINSLINTVFSSNLHIGHCIYCTDVLTVKSEKYCKICKLKYSKKFMNSCHVSNHSPDYDGFRDLHIENSSYLLGNHKKIIKESNTNVSERRRCSLVRKLRKIRHSNWMLVPSK